MNKEKTFEQSMERLNELVAILERNEAPLDETIACFEEGLKLVQELDKKLQGYQMRVNEMMKDSDNDGLSD